MSQKHNLFYYGTLYFSVMMIISIIPWTSYVEAYKTISKDRQAKIVSDAGIDIHQITTAQMIFDLVSKVPAEMLSVPDIAVEAMKQLKNVGAQVDTASLVACRKAAMDLNPSVRDNNMGSCLRDLLFIG